KAPFQAVELLVDKNGVVATIKIKLAAPLNAKRLAEQLSLDSIETVRLTEGNDEPIGLAFPERGVTFLFAHSEKVTPVGDDKAAAAPTTAVSQVVIQPLDAHLF